MCPPVLPYVYKLVHRTTGQFYFGYRFKNKVSALDDLGKKYFSSSKYVRPIFNEFDFEIIAEVSTREEAFELEQLLIRENFANPLILNRHYHKQGGIYFAQRGPHSAETRAKIGAAQRGRKRSQAEIEKQRQSHLGKKASVETLEKMSRSMKGKKKTPEHLSKISKALKGSGNINKAIQVRAENQKKKCTVDGCTIFNSVKELTSALGFGKNGLRSPSFRYIKGDEYGR